MIESKMQPLHHIPDNPSTGVGTRWPETAQAVRKHRQSSISTSQIPPGIQVSSPLPYGQNPHLYPDSTLEGVSRDGVGLLQVRTYTYTLFPFSLLLHWKVALWNPWALCH